MQLFFFFAFFSLVFLLALSRYNPSLGCAPLLALSYRQGISDMHLIQNDHPEVASFWSSSSSSSSSNSRSFCNKLSKRKSTFQCVSVQAAVIES